MFIAIIDIATFYSKDRFLISLLLVTFEVEMVRFYYKLVTN